jgi:tRNA nucleotidyltransferase/poly(A) polymerase
MGLHSKDWDFTCVAESFEAMEQSLLDDGFTIFVRNPEFFTIRAHGPKGFTFAGHDFGKQTFDFVWARKDGTYSDGRRPDFVTPGTLHDDLARRDLTVNAIAKATDGTLIDPFNGQQDIKDKIIRCVGDPRERFEEDALRILRALRFSVTKGFAIHNHTASFVRDLRHTVAGVSAERVREELTKMFNHDAMKTVAVLNEYQMFPIIFDMGINFQPTMKEKIR